ncbi:MAG: D-hexose-6-phosphate mutarotase [Betaproteobacteria bacterium]|nr:MAG: D-hexose-6-phosphate mutarotase [Betaproteobacteria bacterium]
MALTQKELHYGMFNGLPALLVHTPFSTAAVSLFGGHVLSFVAKGFEDVLWMSPTTKRPPDAIRGGIPVCWPYFAKQGQPSEAPQHGLVRTRQWKLTHAEQTEAGEIVLALSAPLIDDVPMSLMLTMRIGRALEQALTTVNMSSETVRFTQALHTYFKVGDAMRVSVEGLDGLTYRDKFDDFNEHVQRGAWHLFDPRDPGRSDRIYMDTGNRFELNDPTLARKITIEMQGSKTLVAWNPGEEAVKGFVDIPASGWRDYVCLEAANCGNEIIELAPEDSHVLQQTISVAALVSH